MHSQGYHTLLSTKSKSGCAFLRESAAKKNFVLGFHFSCSQNGDRAYSAGNQIRRLRVSVWRFAKNKETLVSKNAASTNVSKTLDHGKKVQGNMTGAEQERESDTEDCALKSQWEAGKTQAHIKNEQTITEEESKTGERHVKVTTIRR